MAEILNNQFISVFSSTKGDIADNKILPRECGELNDIEVTTEEMIAAMKSIDASSSPGPDEIPSIIYNNYSEELAYPATKIWRLSLNTGRMPEGTILAIIAPIYKEGDKSMPSNYRPIALTNHLTKIFERLLRKEIVNHLERNNLMNTTQHGFRAAHSTISQLLRYYDSILSMLEEGHCVDTIYLDFAKAFDKVDHNILLMKLRILGVKGNIHRWIGNFLHDRQQQVKVEDQLSSKKWVLAGVPQGSVLGPILFLVMMIDINKNLLNATIGSFADDTRLWQIIQGEECHYSLQQDLLHMYSWADDNNMLFNDGKFETLHYGKQVNNNAYLTLEGLPIERKDCVKDLGVRMTADGKFSTHISNIVLAAHRMTGWVLRTFKTRKTSPMITLLKTLIVSKVEYACVLWSPRDVHNISLIENVQRRFTRRFAIFQNWDNELGMPTCTTNYWERIKTLKIFSLERRRERYMIIYVYKIVIGISPNPGLNIQYHDRTKIKVEPKLKLNAPAWVKTLRYASFFYTAPKLYNSLPTALRELEGIIVPVTNHVVAFKRKLDEFLKRIPDQPTTAGLYRRAESNSIIHQIHMIAGNEL